MRGWSTSPSARSELSPRREGQRGLFGRGLRDVWLAQGGGRIQGVRGGRAVESWFFPAAGDEPYTYTHVVDTPATAALRRELGIAREGTRVTVPLAEGRPPPNARLRRLVTDLVQLRPILEDETRELLLEVPGEPLQLVRYTPPEPDPERPLLFDDKIELQRGVTARVIVRRAVQPIALSPARAARRGGLVIVSGRAAHETTLAGADTQLPARIRYGWSSPTTAAASARAQPSAGGAACRDPSANWPDHPVCHLAGQISRRGSGSGPRHAPRGRRRRTRRSVTPATLSEVT
jgi:hypothetical protein